VAKASKTFSALLEKLNQNGNETRYLPYPNENNSFPDIFLTVTRSMIENYKKYGQVIGFDVTYNTIKRKNNEHGWGLGVFWGKNCHNHIIIFGISLINR